MAKGDAKNAINQAQQAEIECDLLKGYEMKQIM